MTLTTSQSDITICESALKAKYGIDASSLTVEEINDAVSLLMFIRQEKCFDRKMMGIK